MQQTDDATAQRGDMTHNQITLSDEAEARLQFWAAPADAMFPAPIVAHVLGVSAHTLANWRSDEKGPKHRRKGHSTYYAKSAVQEWMQSEVA